MNNCVGNWKNQQDWFSYSTPPQPAKDLVRTPLRICLNLTILIAPWSTTGPRLLLWRASRSCDQQNDTPSMLVFFFEMADELSKNYGRENDKSNCPFYFKIGACRHENQCSRNHHTPVSSVTLLLKHLYINPPIAIAIAEGQPVSDRQADQAQQDLENFYKDLFFELSQFGRVREIAIVDNIGDHLLGSVFARLKSERDAEYVKQKFISFRGQPVNAEFSPVIDFQDSRCTQFEDGKCARGGFCNFLHWKHIPRAVKKRTQRNRSRSPRRSRWCH